MPGRGDRTRALGLPWVKSIPKGLLSLAIVVGPIALQSHTIREAISTATPPPAIAGSSETKALATQACEALERHTNGKWHHRKTVDDRNRSSTNSSHSSSSKYSYARQYLPKEMDWLNGTSNEWLGGCGSAGTGYNTPALRGHMYASPMGNQCGCHVSGFEPSDSQWVWEGGGDGGDEGGSNDDATESGLSYDDQRYESPSFRLIERLAKSNNTMCIAGDSLDLQFYTALVNNLYRVNLLGARHNHQIAPFNRLRNMTIEQTSLPVTYTKENTGRLDYSKYWMCMKEIQQTTFVLNYKNGEQHRATLQYYKVYGWSPWNFIFMDDCDVLSYTLGIHYETWGIMNVKNYGFQSKMEDDFRAAITYLSGFEASGREVGKGEGGGGSSQKKVAIWREVLPQHFDSEEGHFPHRPNPNGSKCTALPQGANGKSTIVESDNHLEVGTNSGGSIQKYNRIANEGFAKHCRLSKGNSTTNSTPSSLSSCDNNTLRHTCTVNLTDTTCRTVYKHLVDNNVTAKAEQIRRQDSVITGDILRWNVADLFDVPHWHTANGDCSHFCYIPALYEEAFRRLGLLLDINL